MYESFCYHPDRGLKTGLTVSDMADALKDGRSTLWLDVLDIEDADIDILTNVFGLHPLTVEDFIMPNTRAKVEEFPGYLFLVAFSVGKPNGPEKEKGRFGSSEFDCCLGGNFLITSHNGQCGPICACKDRVIKHSPMIMQGADMLLYSVLDACADNYSPVIAEFDTMVDEMSDELFRSPTQETLKKIYMLKNDVMKIRRMIGPQADVIGLLARGSYRAISPASAAYFRNIYDDMMRFNDTVGASRDVISGAMEAYVSISSNRLNEIMKTLTVIATIMMPLTLIASIYGMNFKNMPELSSVYGYPTVILTMVLITVLMVIYFRRRKWI
jgi:magnesium transporter